MTNRIMPLAGSSTYLYVIVASSTVRPPTTIRLPGKLPVHGPCSVKSYQR